MQRDAAGEFRRQTNNDRLSLPYRRRCNQSKGLRQNAAKYRSPAAEPRRAKLREEEIEGAESSTYRLGIADEGESIACGVEAINSAGAEYEFSSNEIVVPWLGTLSVTKTGGGSGTVSSAPAGIICGVSCAAVFEEGTAIMLTAVADSGSEFTGWSGACSGTGVCAFTLGERAEVVANFARMRNDGGGAHTPSPPATPAPAVSQAKKPLRCKVGFRKEKHKGKIRCVKAKPSHKSSPKAKGGRA